MGGQERQKPVNNKATQTDIKPSRITEIDQARVIVVSPQFDVRLLYYFKIWVGKADGFSRLSVKQFLRGVDRNHTRPTKFWVSGVIGSRAGLRSQCRKV